MTCASACSSEIAAGGVLRTVYARVPTRNMVNVHTPRPPRTADTAVARCCY